VNNDNDGDAVFLQPGTSQSEDAGYDCLSRLVLQQWLVTFCWLCSAGWDEASTLHADGGAGKENVTVADGGWRPDEGTASLVCHVTLCADISQGLFAL